MQQRDPQTLIARLETRRRARGAVLVEGIIVSSMLITLMAGGLFLHRLYVAQIRALENARLAAWSQALQGCSSAIDLSAIWQEAGESSDPLDVDTDSAPSFFGTVSHTSGSASETASADARVSDKTYELIAKDSVACNEIPQNKRGDAISLIGYIAANVIPSFF
ncbi:MAG TPA: hypothetical protein VGC79_30210 [Polyangiaceae bacterium]